MISILVFFINISLSQSLTDSLVAFYPFNGNANDESGNFYNATVYGASLTNDRAGNSNSAYRFDGLDDYISLPSDFDFKERSISIWLNVTEAYGYQRIYYSDHQNLNYSSTNIDVFRDNQTNKLFLRLEAGGGQAEDILFNIQLNTWYHAVITIDSLFTKAYVDGKFINSVPFVNHHADKGLSNAFIGTNNDTIRYFFNGSIDDIRIYNRTLNADEIDSLYNEKTTLIADFAADTTSGIDSLTVHFTDLSTTVADSIDPISSWQWDFDNDGLFDSDIQNPTFTYKQPGLYSVRLVVANGSSSNQKIKMDYINVMSKFPIIRSVTDIPDDQGGWVKVQFTRSIYDSDSLMLAKMASSELYTIEIDDGSGWTAAASTAAYGKSLYSVLVPTTKDLTAESNGLINFRVIAAMEEGNFASNEMMGYSVDNLKPDVPIDLIASFKNSKIELIWQPNTEADLNYYTIYKGTGESSLEKLATTTIPYYTDSEVIPGYNYLYAVSATDQSGNESTLSDITGLTITGLAQENRIPKKYYLDQNYPNPFNPTTTIKYGLPKNGTVKIVVYDALGHIVKVLLDSYQSAGNHQVIWNGKNEQNKKISTGIYYYKINAANFTQFRKMLLIK